MSISTRRWGVRARTTVLAMFVVAAVLAVSAALLLTTTRGKLEASIIEDVTERTRGLAALAAAGDLADPLPGPDTELYAQVVDGSGNVVAADPILSGLGPFFADDLVHGERVVLRVSSLFGPGATDRDDLVSEGPYVIVAEGVDLPDGTGAVLVAASLDDVDAALEATTPVALIGIPILTAAVGLITWFLTGRALRPVELMRAGAESISAADLSRRLPVPESRDEVHALAMTLNDMLGRLEASADEQRRFVADASHELKSPLTALGTMVEVTKRGAGSAELGELMDDLGVEIDRLQRLVGDLIYLARYDETHPPLNMSQIDLDEMVRIEAVSTRQRSELEVDISAVEPVRVRGDRYRLEQLVRNLTDNAARYAATMIWLETGQQDGVATVVVSDDGAGIPDTDRQRVFDRFVRLDESRSRASGGTGLGLAVARAIARSHHGDVVVSESRHGGATLEVRIPADAGTGLVPGHHT